MADKTDELARFWKRAVNLSHLITGLGAIVLLFALPQGRAAAVGLIVGGLAGVLRWRLRYGAVRRMDRGALVRSRLIGYAVSGAALALAFGLRQIIWPWSTVAGLLVMNVAVVTTELLDARRQNHASTS